MPVEAVLAVREALDIFELYPRVFDLEFDLALLKAPDGLVFNGKNRFEAAALVKQPDRKVLQNKPRSELIYQRVQRFGAQESEVAFFEPFLQARVSDGYTLIRPKVLTRLPFVGQNLGNPRFHLGIQRLDNILHRLQVLERLLSEFTSALRTRVKKLDFTVRALSQRNIYDSSTVERLLGFSFFRSDGAQLYREDGAF